MVAKAKTKRNRVVRRMTAKKRLEELDSFVGLCLLAIEMDASVSGDLKEIANRAMLSVSTIRRLIKREISLKTHFGTIQKLGIAAGLRLEMTEYEASVRVVD